MLKLKKSPLRWALLLGLAFVTTTALAQLPVSPSAQFDINGFLQEATLNATTPLAGGTLTVNGQLVIVPANTIVILPANALTWEELFAQAPLPYGSGIGGNGLSGLAMKDVPTPLTTWEVHVVGNRVADQYIAGLIDIAQNGLNSGAGYINFIDYTLGEIRVGGLIGSNTTGTRVRINDPNGRYGRGTTSPDIRWTVDPDNPTIMAGTGYPMCLPRSAPAGGASTDALCPEENRPRDLTGNPVGSFTTNNLSNLSFPTTAAFPNSTVQAPFEVGDFVTFSGTLVQDCATCLGGGTIAGPWPLAGAAATWISAHTIVSNVAIYTFPGSDPAYIETDVTLIGTGGLSVLGVGEAAIRTRFEGMMTDPSRSVHVYGIDLDPGTGATTDRDWGTIGVDPGPPTGAVKGRWRFRPPCLPFGSVPTKPDKQCVMNAADTFLPPTREMRSVIEGLQSQNPANATAVTTANGLFYGQYHAPILEYIFPENIPGTPIVENNFNTVTFLACGGYTSSAGTLAPGALAPWPSNVAPTGCVSSITPPSVTATATPTTAAAGATVTLAAIATGTAPLTFAWTQTSGPAVILATPAAATTTFTAPADVTASTLGFSVTVSNGTVPATATVSVGVGAVGAPTVSYVPDFPVAIASGTPVTIVATAVDPAGLNVFGSWIQLNAGAPGVPTVVIPNPMNCAPAAGTATCTLSFTPILPIGSPSVTIQVAAQATNSFGIQSALDYTNVTVNPPPDTVTITSSVYRFGKQRLDITVTDSVISPSIVVTLDPYLTQLGTTFDPASIGNTFTNNGGGLYSITIVGAPEPACNLPLTNADPQRNSPCTQVPLRVRTNTGGVSPLSPLNKTRL